jgi:hypothetical protein
MAVDFTSGFESGAFADWTSVSPTPPTAITTDKWSGTYAMRSDITSAAQYVAHNYAAEPAVAVCRFMFAIEAVGSSSLSTVMAETYNAAQTDVVSIMLNTDGSGVPTVTARIYDGSFYTSSATSALSTGTWYRFECKADMSATAWAVTFGIGTGNGALTTVETNYTGGNSCGASTADAWFLGQSASDPRIILYDDFAHATLAADYPIGPLMQTFRPDADTVTTGWTATPLWSKIEEETADGTVITATAG